MHTPSQVCMCVACQAWSSPCIMSILLDRVDKTHQGDLSLLLRAVSSVQPGHLIPCVQHALPRHEARWSHTTSQQFSRKYTYSIFEQSVGQVAMRVKSKITNLRCCCILLPDPARQLPADASTPYGPWLGSQACFWFGRYHRRFACPGLCV